MEGKQNKIFIILTIILLVLGGIAFWLYKKNIYSKEVLKLEILGPETAQTGEEIDYIVKYKNNGNACLEELQLIFEYPEDALPIDRDLERITQALEDLYPGQEETLSFKAKLFGKKGDIRTVRATLSYRPKNIKAFYESKSSFSTEVKETPITLVFDTPSKVVANKEAKISLNYFSNFGYPLSDLGIKIDYPSGFEFLKSKPGGIEKNEWRIGILNKAEGGRIEVYGTINGEIGAEKIFRAQIGTWVKNRFVVLKEVSRGVEIVRPRLVISQRINGFSDYIANPNELLHYEIYFRNIGDSYFEDLFLVTELEGPFDFNSANLEGGKVNASDKSILWDWREVEKLKFLGAGEEGKIEFWIGLKENWPSSDLNNPVLRSKVSLAQLEDISEIRINSKLVVSQKGFFEDETFGNSGHIPPKTGEKTTYTIVWEVKNYYNNVKNAKVRAVLPNNVELTGQIFPEEEKEKLVFDSSSREILWTIGGLEAGVGVSSSPKVLIFQVKFEPDEEQKGLVVTLINEARVSGEDQWTSQALIASSSAVDTTLPDDPTVDPGEGVVQ